MVFRAMHAHPEAAGGKAARSVDRHIQDYVDRLEKVIRSGARAGYFRAPKPRRAARFLVESVRGIVIERLREKKPPRIEDDVETLLQIYLNGISD